MTSGCNPDLNYDQFTANGTQTNFVITFNYHDSEDIRARINNVEMDNTLYSINPGNPSEVIFNPAPAAGTLFIYRCTDLSSLSAVFNAGATIRAVDLNDNFEQLLLAIEDANNLRVQDIDNQAVNLGYQPDLFDPANSPGVITNNKGSNAALPIVTQTRAGIQSGADKIKLDGIEVGATTDQTGAEIKTLYESQADTNAFTDADHTKLDGIATGATVSQWSDVSGGIAYSAGNVGIGTSSPAHNLDISPASGAAELKIAGAEGQEASIRLYADQGDDAADIKKLLTDTSGNFKIQHYSGSAFVDSMVIDSSGKVGVGTTNPANQFEVVSSTATKANFTHASSNKTSLYLESDDTSARIGSTYYGSGGSFKPLAFLTAGTEQMRIDSSGHILVGTTTAGFASYGDSLTIANSSHCGMTLRGGTTSDTEIFFADGTTGTARYTGGIRYAHNTDHMQFTVNAAERMRIDSSGRLLVGTTTEGEATADNLTIADSGNCGITLRSGTSSVGTIFFSDATSGADEYRGVIQYDHNGDYFKWVTAGAERMRIDSSGSVGIGVSDASTGDGKLTILASGTGSGTANTRVFMSGYEGTSGNKAGLWFGARNNENTGVIGSRTATGSIAFETYSGGWGERMRIDSSGSATFTSNVNLVGSSSYLLVSRTGATGTTTIAQFGTDSNAQAIEFKANGSATFAGAVTASNVSDIRFKENITDANPQLADAVALGSQLKNFDWNDDAPLNEELRAKRFLGLVAQEAEKVCPGLTYTVPRTKQGVELTPAVLDEEGNETKAATYEELDDSYKAINHDILVMKLLGAVAELSAKVAALEAG